MRRVGLVWRAGSRIACQSNDRGGNMGEIGIVREREVAHDSLSGNHWQVRLGQSRACVIMRSYRYGAFFFLLKYVHKSTYMWDRFPTISCTPAGKLNNRGGGSISSSHTPH